MLTLDYLMSHLLSSPIVTKLMPTGAGYDTDSFVKGFDRQRLSKLWVYNKLVNTMMAVGNEYVYTLMLKELEFGLEQAGWDLGFRNCFREGRGSSKRAWKDADEEDEKKEHMKTR
jgi:hypothetical protein